MNERQLVYLQVLADTASAVKARAAARVGRRQVSNWERDELFADAAAEALETAQGAIRDKVRELALAGDQQMLALSMKVIEPALQSKPVQVGVQVNGGRHAQLDDVDLVERARRIVYDHDLRAEQDARYVDVDSPTPAPADEPTEAPVRPEDLL